MLEISMLPEDVVMRRDDSAFTISSIEQMLTIYIGLIGELKDITTQHNGLASRREMVARYTVDDQPMGMSVAWLVDSDGHVRDRYELRNICRMLWGKIKTERDKAELEGYLKEYPIEVIKRLADWVSRDIWPPEPPVQNDLRSIIGFGLAKRNEVMPSQIEPNDKGKRVGILYVEFKER